jgi:putative restriction endonuclease
MGMDPELTARISPEHRRRLAWFEEHQGQVSPAPEPLAGGLRLVSTPKGIYKPADLPYALSIKIKLDSPYADGVPVPTPGGGWLLEYHQEGPDPAARDAMFTNRGLMQCTGDRVPVGVLRERAPASHRTRYDVLGLAVPVRWSDGRFYFESLNPKAVPIVDPVSDVLEAMARAEVDQETAAQTAALDDDYDARLRVYRQIVSRQGQAGFRAALLEAYGGQCAVTGFDAVPALEGAHLRPYRGPGSNHVTNGLLLRADIHTLFDLGLLAPEPVTRTIVVSKLLVGTQYVVLSGSQLADPALAWQRPNQEALEIVWQRFSEAEDGRLCR